MAIKDACNFILRHLKVDDCEEKNNQLGNEVSLISIPDKNKSKKKQVRA